MIRNSGSAHVNLRPLSTSQDSTKMKKPFSTSTKNKADVSMGSTSMTSSIKKSRLETSKSSKKNKMNTSTSNKSIKALRENSHATKATATNPAMFSAKKKDDKEKDDKKGAIMVKNIKNKIVGSGHSNVKVGKENLNSSKKYPKIDYKGISTQQEKPETPRTPKDHLNKRSFANFSMIAKRVSEEHSENTLSLDMFELGRKLGKGRFGDVYMAREIRTGFALAIKVINKKQLKESEMQSQLIQQIKIQLYSNHPNILKMYGFFSDDKKIYLLLELATSGCLFKQIRAKNYFSENQACYYFRQVTSGIRYLHSNSVIHRDIKPQNILNCFNVLKICDFGWAIYSPIYQRQTFCGTLDYVPPEIVTGDFYDEKADVWCLGVLCYELCTGRAPFESKTDENETYNKILKVQIEFPIYLSAMVVDFIGKILNRDPQRRMNLEDVESHEWMRQNQNQAGRMISKDIWDIWMKLGK